VATEPIEDEADLGLLARQTLTGVEVTEVPPEPFALGVDLERLAMTSRPPGPPRKADDTDGRIDLRASSPGVLPAPAAQSAVCASTAPTVPAANAAAALAARLRAQRGGQVVGASRTQTEVVRTGEPRPITQVDRELDALIASRSFSASAAFESWLKTIGELVRRAPSWTWVLACGIAIGLVMGLALSGGDDAEPPAPTAASVEAQAPIAGVPVLPQAVASSHSALATRPGSNATPQRARASGDRGARHASGQLIEQAPAGATAVAAAPQPPAGEPRSIDTLLDQAIGNVGASPANPAASAGPARSGSSAAASSRPATPARDEVARLLSSVLPRIRFCAGGRSGVATAQIVAKSTGRITNVKIIGAPFSRTTAARCMETAIRGVAFSPFSQPTFRVTYPYAL
jgi:hypothetical protein